jgi:hypothetical protein
MKNGYIVNARECEVAGVDEDRVTNLARKLALLAIQAESMGLTIFGGAGHADFRKRESTDGTGGALIVAQILVGNWDGGDGGNCPDSQGLLRGES